MKPHQRLWKFLKEEKKWWLLPLIICFLLLGALVYMTQAPPPLSPFMYPGH